MGNYINDMTKFNKKILMVSVLIITFPFFFTTECFAKKTVTDGKGIWINLWNYPANPDMYCEYLKSKNIDSIYLQISRSNTPGIKHPGKLNKIIESCHDRDIKVIGWSYVFLKEPIHDAQKFIQGATYKTPSGETLDGFAADIEEISDSFAIEKFTKRIRQVLGPDYPLIAVIFSPLSMAKNAKLYSWRTVANNFDIIAPMTYWHGLKKYRSEQGAYYYTAQTISKIKELTKKDDLKIHIIGDGQKTTSHEIKGFLKAAKDHQVNAGVSLYPYHIPTEHQVETLSRSEF